MSTSTIYGQDPLEFIRETAECVRQYDAHSADNYLTGSVGHVRNMTVLELVQRDMSLILKAVQLLESEGGETHD